MNNGQKPVGILAIQGDFAMHGEMLDRIGTADELLPVLVNGKSMLLPTMPPSKTRSPRTQRPQTTRRQSGPAGRCQPELIPSRQPTFIT